MSGEDGRRESVSRRDFMKVTGTVLGASALTYAAQPVMKTLAVDFTAGQAAQEGEQLFECVCRPNCQGYCRMNVHVRNGRVVKTSLLPFVDTNYNRICLRGLSHVQGIYDAERVKYPMKRAGERGENKWERISWEEAIDEIATNFTRIKQQYGDQAVGFYQGSGNVGSLSGCIPGITNMLLNVLNATAIDHSVDAASTLGINRLVGNAGMWVANEPTDYKNANTLFAWGSNITDAQVHEWHCVADAMDAGVKLVVIDPNFTQLAAKADMWVSIRPGSDTALLLAMMYVILDEGAQNDEFLIKHTVAPFLVRDDNGKFLRMSDLGVAPTAGPVDQTTGKPTSLDPVVVWDVATAGAASVDTAASPGLTGSHELAGIKVRTAFEHLKEEILKYSPATAEKLTDVPADTIVELAHLAMNQPVAHRVGWGPQAYSNGVHASSAGITLCALLGNIGYPGASFGGNWNYYPGLNWGYIYPTGPSASPSVSHLVLRETMRTGKFMAKDYPIKAMYFYQSNAVCTAANTNEFVRDIIGNLEFIVTIDSAFTDTARYSDIVLPVAGHFEQEEVITGGATHYLQYSEKAIEPLYESKSDAAVVRLIADKMGVGEYFQMTDDEYQTEILKSEYSAQLGVTFEALKSEKAMRYFPRDPYIAWEGNKFLTPSGRVEFYLEDPKPRMEQGQQVDVDRERVPRFFPPSEAWPENELYAKYPLVLTSVRPRHRVHSTWFSNAWLRELDPEPTVKINPVDAEARSIKNDDYIEVYNDRGHAVAKAVLSEGVRPGVLVYAKSWQAHQHKAGSWSELMSSVYDPVGVNGNFMDNLAEARVWNGEV